MANFYELEKIGFPLDYRFSPAEFTDGFVSGGRSEADARYRAAALLRDHTTPGDKRSLVICRLNGTEVFRLTRDTCGGLNQ